jgi:tetratricopeptide (TPR) repeat protein
MRLARRHAIAAAALAAASISAQAGQGSDRPAPPEPTAQGCSALVAPTKQAEAPTAPPVLVEGLGYAGIVPDTANGEARRWFEQGVRLIWAYDEVEAIRSFEQAQKLDPACALCAWGEAWARGPTLNLRPRTEEHGAAAAAISRASALKAKLGERDRALVEAMQLRIGKGNEFRSRRYMRAMAKLAARFPGDDAVLVIAADAHMLGARNPQEGAPAQTFLETVLRRNYDHSGAIHLYIHLTDFIDKQKLAEPYAERLGRLAPAASHLVHMPSHTFYGVGRYADAAKVNLAALDADNAYARRVRPPKSDYRNGLYGHNTHFIIESSLMRGDGATALRIADHFAERFPAEADTGFRPVARAATWYAYGLHADPAKVLAMAEPKGKQALMRAMRHYARGEALARKGDASGVKAEAAALTAFLASPDARTIGLKPAEALVSVVLKVLEGRAAMIESRFADASAAYREGMVLQGKAGFAMDPPPFWYSVRRSLGAAMLAAGDADGARLQLLETLKDWPDDPLALYTLARAEKALGRADEAQAHMTRARSAWSGNIELMPLARI